MDKIQGMDLQEVIDALQKLKDSGLRGTVLAISNDGYLGGNIVDIEYAEDQNGEPTDDVIINVNIDYPFTLEELRTLDIMLQKDFRYRATVPEHFKRIHKKIRGAIEYAEAVVEED